MYLGLASLSDWLVSAVATPIQGEARRGALVVTKQNINPITSKLSSLVPIQLHEYIASEFDSYQEGEAPQELRKPPSP